MPSVANETKKDSDKIVTISRISPLIEIGVAGKDL